jgi:hypothetical protein
MGYLSPLLMAAGYILVDRVDYEDMALIEYRSKGTAHVRQLSITHHPSEALMIVEVWRPGDLVAGIGRACPEDAIDGRKTWPCDGAADVRQAAFALATDIASWVQAMSGNNSASREGTA